MKLKQNVVHLGHPPDSPDMTTCDFWLFSLLKMPLEGYRFDENEIFEIYATNALKAIEKSDRRDYFR